MKKSLLLIAGISLSMLGYSQNNPQVEKQMMDPQRKTNAGKADVIIAKDKSIYDSTTFDKKAGSASENKTSRTATKNKHCKRKKSKPGL